MSADDVFSCDLPYKERALAVHRGFIRVRGCALLREHTSAPPNCILSNWEQAIVDGRSTAVVLHLLNYDLGGFEDVIELRSSVRKVLAAEHRKSEAVRAFEEINQVIVKWIDLVPDWTPALASFQEETLQRSDGRSQLPTRRPRIPVRPQRACSPGHQVPSLAPQQAAQVSRIVSLTLAELEAEVSSL
jgi:hypothetical protein